MTWPFRSLRAKLLERDVELLQARIRDLEADCLAAGEREKYWRTRYERVADMVLFRNGDTIAPVHVEPTAQPGDNVGRQVMRVANLVGSHAGVKFNQPKGSSADLPAQVIR